MHYSPTRRDFSMVALLGISALAAGAAKAGAAVEIPAEDALKVLDPWLDALMISDAALQRRGP